MAEATLAEEGAAFLQGLFERIPLDIAVRPGAAKEGGPEGALVLELRGPEVEAVGRRPELRSALGLLVSQVLARSTEDPVRCTLDTGGDFEVRGELLAAVARDVARSVSRTGRRAVIERLSSSERRVVHTALAEDKSVATRSEGDEGARVLLVERAGAAGRGRA